MEIADFGEGFDDERKGVAGGRQPVQLIAGAAEGAPGQSQALAVEAEGELGGSTVWPLAGVLGGCDQKGYLQSEVGEVGFPAVDPPCPGQRVRVDGLGRRSA